MVGDDDNVDVEPGVKVDDTNLYGCGDTIYDCDDSQDRACRL